jgi:4-amino-4-deoxy-L-arabinose transferase-like glycosyltransferase
MLAQVIKDENRLKRFERYVFPAVLVIIFLLPHLPFLNNGYVDLEKYCVQAGLDIAKHGLNANLTDYYSTVFNPIFSVLLLAGSYSVLGESPVISRLTVSILALAFSLFLYFYLRNKKGAGFAFITTLLVVVNPMFIVYSQYVYSDIPFMVFVSAALLLLLYGVSRKATVISSVLLGISLATKYVAAPLFLVGLFLSLLKTEIITRFSKSKLYSFIRFNLWYFILALVISVPFILLVLRYQPSIFPSHSDTMYDLSLTMYVSRLFACLLWLGLFIGPFCIYDLWKKAGVKVFLLLLGGSIALTLLVSWFYPVSSLHIQAEVFGEMNLGWVESKAPSWALSLAFFLIIIIAELFIASLAFDIKRLKKEKTGEIFTWILLPILIFSFTRVTNRYMLAILAPLSLYMTLVSNKVFSKSGNKLVPVMLTLHVLVFLVVGFYSNYYLYLRGLA